MNGRELGCKTIGCGAAIFIILSCFYGMLATTERVAKKAKLQRHARGSQSAVQNLQLLAITLANYSAKNDDELPPLQSAGDFQASMVPEYLGDADVLINPRDRKPFLPNAFLSRRKRGSIKDPETTYILAESSANDTGKRAVLLLSGTVKEVSEPQWASLQRMPVSLPSPSPQPTKSVSPP